MAREPLHITVTDLFCGARRSSPLVHRLLRKVYPTP